MLIVTLPHANIRVSGHLLNRGRMRGLTPPVGDLESILSRVPADFPDNGGSRGFPSSIF